MDGPMCFTRETTAPDIILYKVSSPNVILASSTLSAGSIVDLPCTLADLCKEKVNGANQLSTVALPPSPLPLG